MFIIQNEWSLNKNMNLSFLYCWTALTTKILLFFTLIFWPLELLWTHWCIFWRLMRPCCQLPFSSWIWIIIPYYMRNMSISCLDCGVFHMTTLISITCCVCHLMICANLGFLRDRRYMFSSFCLTAWIRKAFIRTCERTISFIF